MAEARSEQVDAVTGTPTTGHEWDGLRELNTPLPRWWLWLFYATIVNIVYGFILMFTDYSGVGSFIGTLIGSALGFYFLFQIRDRYLGSSAKTSTPKNTSKK